MTLLLAWLVFPLVLGALCLGCALLLERASGMTLPGATLLPLGFATATAVAQFATLTGTTAQLATPAVVAVAILGYGLTSRAWRTSRPDPWLLTAGVATFAIYAVPVLLSGRATFLGYIKLDDTATYLAMLDRAMEHGYDVSGLAPSTYEATLHTSLALGYPLGALLPWGIGSELVRTDPAWLWQPYIAFLAVLVALGLHALVGGIVRSNALRAGVAVIGAQAALIFGYAMWGGIKELAIAGLVGLIAILVPITARGDQPRRVLPLAAASAAVVGVLSVGGAAWLAPLLVGAIALTLGASGVRSTVRNAVAFAAAACAFAIPSFVAGAEWLSHTGDFTGESGYGNLLRRLSPLQAFGIWPSGDFRVRPESIDVTRVLVLTVAVAAAGALVVAWRRRAWELPLALGTAAFACVVYVSQGSPWIGGKALASSSPLVLAAALAAAAALLESGRRIEGSVLGGVIVVAVLWSNALQYHEVSLAPSERLAELETIANRFAGEGPALASEYDPYATRHFLRELDAESPSELRRHFISFRDGRYLSGDETGVSPDIDELRLDDLLFFRTLVVRRSAVSSRPPSAYSLMWNGEYYQVWQRVDTAPRIVEHLSLGSRLQPAAVPSCSEVRRLGRIAAAQGGRVAAVEREPTIVIDTDGSVGAPSTFGAYGQHSGALYPRGALELESRFVAPSAGRYGIWVGGSFRSRVAVFIDGESVGSARAVLQWPGNFVELGEVDLSAGEHTLRVTYAKPGWLRPGDGGRAAFGLGPFAIARGTQARPVTLVEPESARTLCGRSLDWVEALAG